MVCKKCNAECPDDSVFCLVCGERADGRKCCPVCKKPIIEGTVLCDCGARVDGKKFCPCGKEQETDAKFCPACGRAQFEQEETEVKEKQKDSWSKEYAQKLGTIFSYIVTGLSMFSLLVFFIAIFTPIFQGKGMGLSRYFVLRSGGMYSANDMFYDYFYRIFADFSKFEYENATGYVIFALSSLIVLANMIVSTVMFILGLIKGIKAYTKKQKADLTKYVVAALIVNAIMALWFSASSTSRFVSADGIVQSSSQTAGLGSVLAYVFAAIALTVAAVFKIVEKHKEFVLPKNLARFVLNSAAIIFVFILFGLIGSQVFKFSENYYGTISKVGYGIINMLFVTALDIQYDRINEINAGFSKIFCFSIASAVIFVAIIIICAILLKKLIARFMQGGLETEEGVGCLALAVTACVLSIMYLVFNILVTKSPNMEETKLGAQSVVAVVAAFLALGVLIAAKIIDNASKPKAKKIKQVIF